MQGTFAGPDLRIRYNAVGLNGFCPDELSIHDAKVMGQVAAFAPDIYVLPSNNLNMIRIIIVTYIKMC
jgi:hypothetical protein